MDSYPSLDVTSPLALLYPSICYKLKAIKMKKKTHASVLAVIIWMTGFAAVAMEEEESNFQTILPIKQNEDNSESKTLEEQKHIDFKFVDGVTNTIVRKKNGSILVKTSESFDYQLITPLIPIKRFEKIEVSYELSLKEGTFGIGLLKEDQSAWLAHKIYDKPGFIDDTLLLHGKAPSESGFMALLNRKSTEENVHLVFTNESYRISEFEIRNISFKVKTYPPDSQKNGWDIWEKLSSSLPTLENVDFSWMHSLLPSSNSMPDPDTVITTSTSQELNSLEDDWVDLGNEAQTPEPVVTFPQDN